MGEIHLDDFPVHLEMPVAWGQLDAFGHVNNTQFFRFFEDARIAFFARVGISPKLDGVGPILAKTDCVFRKPLSFPETVTCCARVSELGEDRFTMEYAVFTSNGALSAHGSGRIIMLDYGTGQKVPIPDEIRSAIEALAAD